MRFVIISPNPQLLTSDPQSITLKHSQSFYNHYKPTSAQYQERNNKMKNNKNERLTKYEEIGYADLPQGYEMPKNFAPYIKRPIEKLRFRRARFIAGNDRMLAQWIRQGLSKKQALSRMELATFPIPVLTAEEQTAMEFAIASELDKLFQPKDTEDDS